MRSNNLQAYPRNARLSANLGLVIKSMSSLVKNDSDACFCAGSVEVSNSSRPIDMDHTIIYANIKQHGYHKSNQSNVLQLQDNGIQVV